MKSKIIVPLIAVLFLVLTLPVRADAPAEHKAGIEKASDVLRHSMADGGIPKEILDKAQGMAVIPGVVKGAFIAGGRYGDGVMVTRMAKGAWSSPAFVSIVGASIGAQVGVEVSDLILVFNTRKGADALKDGKVEFGADVALVAGPVGGKGEWEGNINPNVDVYAYSKNERGLFAGISLKGTVMQFDDSANASFYGKSGITPEAIFASAPVTAPMQKNEFTCLVAKATGGGPTC
jgi:lipid-binding SYLF domain-containing protein